MAYGQTGAGKTYTMSGGKDSYKQRGLTPRAISALYHELASRPATAGIVRVRVKLSDLWSLAPVHGAFLAPTAPSTSSVATYSLSRSPAPSLAGIVRGALQRDHLRPPESLQGVHRDQPLRGRQGVRHLTIATRCTPLTTTHPRGYCSFLFPDPDSTPPVARPRTGTRF